MRPLLLLTTGALLFACAGEEHGRAERGQFAPGGPVDSRGNGATARALQKMQGQPYYPGGALPPDQPSNVLTGRVTSIGDGQVQVAPDDGSKPIALRLDAAPNITLGGEMISQQALVEGARVQAALRIDEGKPVADRIEVLQEPGEGPALGDPRLQQPSQPRNFR